MVGDKLKKIITQYESAQAGKGGQICACVHGERGTGKSALLEKVNNSMLMSGVNVFFHINGTHIGSGHSDSAIRELLRQLARMHADKISPDFSDFITAFVKGMPGAGAADNNDCKQYGKDSLLKFIYDCVKAEPTVFIVDDLDRADTFTINMLGNLLEMRAISFIVISHTDKLTNTALSDLLYRNVRSVEYVELQSLDNTGTRRDPRPAVPALDEALLVLSRPGRERQLILHHVKNAGQYMEQMAFEKAAGIYNEALDVCRKALSQNGGGAAADASDIFLHEIDLRISLGRALMFEKKYEEALNSIREAFYSAGLDRHPALPAGDLSKITSRRISASSLLAECCDKLNLPEQKREYIMVAEAYFLLPHNRSQYLDLYRKHILQYLSLLGEADERVIFREKLKQAYSVCPLDDKELSTALLCEEAYTLIKTGDTAKAFELLTQARKEAADNNLPGLWDDATGSLASCAEELEKPELSLLLLTELIDKSCNPVKVAEAIINRATMNFEQDGDEKKAVSAIKTGIDLYTLTGETQILTDIYEHLRYTPLAKYFVR